MSCCIVATLRWWLHLRHPYRYPRLHRNLHHHSQYPLLPQLQMMMLLLFVVVTRIVPMWMWTVAQHKSMDITWIVVTMRLLMVVVMVTNNIFDRPTPSPTSTPPRDPSLPPPATTSNRKIILTMDRDIALPSTTFGGPLPILRFISLRHPNKISVEDKPTFGPFHKLRPCDVFRLWVANSVSWTSGGFMADTLVQGQIENGSQQQWISRNIEVQNGWSGAVWNQVFVGSIGGLSDASFPDPPVSTVADTPIAREKPFLVMVRQGQANNSNGKMKMAVFVPSAVANTRGVSWKSSGQTTSTPGKLLPLEDFLIATPSTLAQEYRLALGQGKHLLFTPGVYNIYDTIRVERAHTVVLGLGHATLIARNGVVPLQTLDAEGIILAGITIDAGPDAVSPVLLQIGDRSQLPSSPATSNPNHPITLSDVYIRVGGPYVGKTNIALEINAHHVLIDHTWIWRADHGIENFDKSDGYGGDNERWRSNVGVNGAIVNGNNVVAMGLFVEHFQQHNLIWNGDNGKVYMFQSELAYEPPSQMDWTQQPSGILGYEAYKVGDAVQNHYLLGGGVYCYNRNNPDIVTERGFAVPKGRSGIVLEHIMTRNLSGPGIIRSIVNGIGPQVDSNNRGPYYLDRYASIDYPTRFSNGISAPFQTGKEEIETPAVFAANQAESSGASIQKGNPRGIIWTIALASMISIVLALR
mmetsp:Transcript_6401/g.15050  ORF Transcript_6401/g.15050 Transcript_6401/m.15050 type:complete len:695 (-) Transcript_6401:1599-3683(-)